MNCVERTEQEQLRYPLTAEHRIHSSLPFWVSRVTTSDNAVNLSLTPLLWEVVYDAEFVNNYGKKKNLIKPSALFGLMSLYRLICPRCQHLNPNR